MLQQLHIQYFGTRPDGSITGGEEGHLFSLAHKLGSKFLHRINNQTVQSDDLFSHFDSLVEDRKRRRTDQEKERIKSKRPRYNDENDDCAEPQTTGRSSRTRRSRKALTYSYMSETEEKHALSLSNGSALVYARNLVKILFANTVDFYSMDQDPGKRQWLKEAIEFRFPARDRTASRRRWNKCTWAIKRYMHISGRNSAERSRKKKTDHTYVSAAYEEECYQKACSNPRKYAELLSLKLFEGSWNKHFRDQVSKHSGEQLIVIIDYFYTAVVIGCRIYHQIGSNHCSIIVVHVLIKHFDAHFLLNIFKRTEPL
ncbi:hypothetical protein KIN20_028025 [Parelaphostrongylus tenuis]|uniref:Uncharacterized protein n=1 Tax=Parelaphostrongylus tenuis TaxID=148309 RepID=A0AAD5R0T8_PARTN|nr:hypothetical protein KIN20_028025 [Parelaphostrongylus tenuis]